MLAYMDQTLKKVLDEMNLKRTNCQNPFVNAPVQKMAEKSLNRNICILAHAVK